MPLLAGHLYILERLQAGLPQSSQYNMFVDVKAETVAFQTMKSFSVVTERDISATRPPTWEPHVK